MSLCKGFTQGGSNADIVLTDCKLLEARLHVELNNTKSVPIAYLKNITNGVDWATAYKAVVSDAEDEPLVWSVEGRGGLHSWKTLNYIPTDDYDPYGVGAFSRSISRTVEYAYDDFCISEMAKGMGHTADYEKYTARSENWRNMYKADQTSYINGTNTGFTGFLQPKYLNQTW